ncbi:MAG: hypothetical protein MRERV_30c003 [Mycoplasmataceae bacterium RV_VA103A]|nr:MAG: hypothetical protein MRERV_30c003 [Mycoplasmataceae bacterium RV_VA103A]
MDGKITKIVFKREVDNKLEKQLPSSKKRRVDDY